MGGRGSGGGKHAGGDRGVIKGAGDAGVQRAQAVVTEKQRASNRAIIDSFNSRTRSQTKTITDGKTGESLNVHIEKVTTRDYWGRSVGEQTYTVKVNKNSNWDSVYYDYGVKGLRGIKNTIKQYTHNS